MEEESNFFFHIYKSMKQREKNKIKDFLDIVLNIGIPLEIVPILTTNGPIVKADLTISVSDPASISKPVFVKTTEETTIFGSSEEDIIKNIVSALSTKKFFKNSFIVIGIFNEIFLFNNSTLMAERFLEISSRLKRVSVVDTVCKYYENKKGLFKIEVAKPWATVIFSKLLFKNENIPCLRELIPIIKKTDFSADSIKNLSVEIKTLFEIL